MPRTQPRKHSRRVLFDLSPAGWLRAILSRVGPVWHAVLAGACVLGAAWQGNELRSESSIAHPQSGIRESRIGDGKAHACDEAPTVAPLMRQLTDPCASVRREAIASLAELGAAAAPAIDALQARLRDRDLFVRIEAARASFRLGVSEERLIPVLCDLLLSENPQVCGLAASALGELGPAAQRSLPALEKRLSSPSAIVRLHCASAVLQIEGNHSRALHELLAGLADESSEVRCFAVKALGPMAMEDDEVILALQRALRDSDTNVAAAARLTLLACNDGGRIDPERRAILVDRPTDRENAAPDSAPVRRVHAFPASSTSGALIITAPVAAARNAAREARQAAQEASRAAAEARAITRVQLATAKAHEDLRVAAADDHEAAANDDPNEGLKPIGSLGVSISMSEGEFPTDVAGVRFASLPEYFHGYGARRGWNPYGFGWEAPAVFFKPIYFEDINLERYGIHQGCLQPAVSFGHFFTRCVCLPYKLIVQPPCECIYTLGYERPNNCIPLYCYCRLGYPSYEKWCQRWTCPCPVSPPCPWDPSADGVCSAEDDCP